jgi:redox-sensing transcriptional repressor
MDPALDFRPIPEPTLRRLPRYLHLLRSLESERETVSSTYIGKELGFDAIQVRKDIEHTGLIGRPKVGYTVQALVQAIEQTLGWNDPRRAFLIGAGSLGTALLGYPRFAESGLDIVAAFDTDESKIGTTIHGKVVLPLEKFDGLVKRMHVLVGILTVPAEQAQAIAERAVLAGMAAIWNFAPVTLRVPSHVVVQNEDLYIGLAALSQKLSLQLRQGALHEKEGHDAVR